ncbi:MAG: putative DNA-binding domain-containing protein [Gammaproteobacteria bacterium]|nr:putative DNA-binding domain-containing protein [Gammaproteobacteria bacterium]
MLPLRELQERFASRLLETGWESVLDWIRADGISASARLGIYRNNLQAGFTKTLALEFPVILRLVGQDYFSQVAVEFLGGHPSRSGDLHHVGAPFPGFLQRRFAASEYSYLADVARLEWAYQECLVAEDSDCMDPHTLRGVPVDAYPNLRFRIRPACRLIDSPFPILRIWEANQPDAQVPDFIDLGTGADHVVLMRTPAALSLSRVPPGDFQLLTAFAAGETLERALDAALGCDPQFDLGAALRRCIGLGVFAHPSFDLFVKGAANVPAT